MIPVHDGAHSLPEQVLLPMSGTAPWLSVPDLQTIGVPGHASGF